MDPYVMEDATLEDMIVDLDRGARNKTITLSLTAPEKIFLKMDISSLILAGEVYLFFTFTDITKIKEVEILKGQIVSMVSHELRSPITAIKGFSEILKESLEGEMKKFAGIINEESERLTRFINTFLDISRIEAGKQEIKQMPVDLLEVVSEVIYAIKPIADKKEMKIRADMPVKVTVVMTDRDLTKQCILNLVENAVKYSPAERDIVLSLVEEKEQLRIDVIDNGYGIAEEDVDRIFEKFYRVESQDIRQESGSGLGLAFVKDAVEAQGGSISIKSAIGKGSTFSVTFPKVL